ncbi:Deoxyribonuclease-2-like protein, partial [Dinothrombium tinctorium]
NNENVDWFIAYKIPKLESNATPFDTGFAFVYLLSTNHESSWIQSHKLIDDKQSLFGQTLNQLYTNPKENYILYSDQPPTEKSSMIYGHSKGVLAVDKNTGFWLIHSVPKFPPLIQSRKYDYPLSGRENGQTALCISFNTSTETEKIVNQLLYIRPKIYDFNLSDDIKYLVPNFNDLINGKWSKKLTNTQSIYTIDFNEFISFSKSKLAIIDIYTDLVASSLMSNLFVETWRKGSGIPLQSVCNQKYTVINVNKIMLQHLYWTFESDHSKWAISDNTVETSKTFLCIGDMNRMKSQFKRGGGIVCFNNYFAWNAFKQSILERDSCPYNLKSESSNQTNIFDTILNFIEDLLISFFESRTDRRTGSRPMVADTGRLFEASTGCVIDGALTRIKEKPSAEVDSSTALRI